MFYAAFQVGNNKPEAHIYCNCADGWKVYHEDTFSPETNIIICLPMKVSGKTYQDRKECARQLAKDFQWADMESSGGGMSMGEYGTISNFFETIGKRYGLLHEFRENAIC